MTRRNSEEEDRPRWHDADEDEPEPREWEIEPEEEKEDRGGVLDRTTPVARVVFAAILLLVIGGGIVALVQALRQWYAE